MIEIGFLSNRILLERTRFNGINEIEWSNLNYKVGVVMTESEQ
jgi:hypothetical protein